MGLKNEMSRAVRATGGRFACWMLAAAALPGASTAAEPPAAPAAAASAPSPAIEVRRYEVQGNTLLPAPELDRTLAAFTGRATLERLRSAAAAVQELYRQAGWGGVIAFLPEQDLKDGLVKIRVVEGKLARIDITENKQFSAGNIRASLPSLQVGATPQVRRIDAEIQLANENPAKTVGVLLQPGEAPGTIVAAVNVQEQAVARFNGRLDNTGGKTIGRWRAALGWQHANVWGADHVFAAELQTAPQEPSAVKVFSGSYRAPLYGKALAIDAYGAWSNVDAGKVGSAAGDLQFSGKGTIAGLRLSAYLPRWGNVDQRVLLGVESRDYKNSCTIDGQPQGACGTAGASVSVAPLSLTYTAQAQGELRWGFSLGLHQNLGGGSNGSQADFEAVRPGSQRRYTVLRTAGQLGLPLGERFFASARLNAQLARKPLVPGEMFGSGGAASVRGFEERELSGDSGATLTLELQGPNLAADWAALRATDLHLLGFADAGTVSNQQDAPCLAGRVHCRMGSLGVGLRASWKDVALRLDLARAMSNATSTAKGDARAHASLNASF